MDEKVDKKSFDELMKRCNIYAFVAGKQIGSIMSLSDAINLNILSMCEIKKALIDIIKESTDDVDKYLFGPVSQA